MPAPRSVSRARPPTLGPALPGRFVLTGLPNVLRHVFLVILTVVVVYPLLWIALGALRTNDDLLLHPFSYPASISLKNYTTVLIGDKFYINIWNSLWISTVTTIVVLLLSTGLAYAIARLEWRLQRLALMYVLSGLLMPVYAALVPLYIYLHGLSNLLGARVALVVPYIALGLPVSVLMLTGYFRGLPLELEESAALDGCSLWRALIHIIVPVSLPAFAVAGTFTFVSAWNELLFALVFLTLPGDQTVAVSLLRFTGQFGTDWVLVLSGITLAVVPTFIVYLLLQRKIMEGFLMGAVVE